MIWLDNAAAAYPKAPGAAAAMAALLEAPAGNAGRPSSLPGLPAGRVAFEARCALAAYLGATDPGRLVFAKNATEALNIAILGAVPPGGTLVLGGSEHNAVCRPALHLERERGVKLIVFPVDGLGAPDPGAFRSALAARPDLVVLSAASNVTGAYAPYQELAAECGRNGVPFLVDGSQAVGHAPADLGVPGLSGFCFSGHKGLLGPEGVGCLWLAEGFEPAPLLYGGTGTDSAAPDMPAMVPERYEAGTQNAAALAGLAAAVDYLRSTGPSRPSWREALAGSLAELPGVRILGPAPAAPAAPIVSAVFDGLSPAAVARELGKRDIAARPGLHCAPWAHRTLGTLESGGTLRFSPGPFTEYSEIEETIRAIKEILE